MMTSAIAFATFICVVAMINMVAWRRAQLQRQAVMVRVPVTRNTR